MENYNLLSGLDVWTTKADDDAGVAVTMSIRNARVASLTHLALGVIMGPWAHRATGFTPLF